MTIQKFSTGQNAPRREDLRLLTGNGRFIADTAPADALHAVFLRSPMAHAEISAIDLQAVRAMPGVRLAMDAAALAAEGLHLPMRGKVFNGAPAPVRPLLAQGRTRFLGEAVAVIVAETREQALDAAEGAALDLSPLPVSVTLEPGGAPIHAEAPDNVAFDWQMGDARAVDDAFARAAHRIALSVTSNRIIAASLEPRGAWAAWQDGRLHLSVSAQGVWAIKSQLAASLKLDPSLIRVTTPDVGGGFGMKAMGYPEYATIAAASRRLGAPVVWISDRAEAMQTDNAGRDLVSHAELALDADHRILAYRVDTRANMGAYNSQFGAAIQSELFSKVLTGVYDIPAAFMRTRGIYTNTTQVDAYRGAGRPEAITVLERTMDHAARELGCAPFDLRARNFIAPGKMPYRSASGELYDTGDFARVLDVARAKADVAGFAARREASRAAGKLRGLGLCCYIESILGDASEGARVEFLPSGRVALYVGTQSNGQGHETVYAQFLADHTGIPVDLIDVIQGDSDLIERGGGTGGSRSVTVQSLASAKTIDKMVAGYTDFLQDQTGAEVVFDDGRFRVGGSNRVLTFLEAAEQARAAGRDDLLSIAERATLPGRSFPNGAHIAEVEIDPETGALTVTRYTVADDFGVLMHPQLAIGQVHGGVAQGFGQAVCENAAYDAQGQLLSGSFMDYALPRAADLPNLSFTHVPVPSTANPIGMKGCGEAGTVGALAAISNAVADALAPLGVTRVDMPFTPARIWGWIAAAQAGDARANR